jgi:hypothetical protein
MNASVSFGGGLSHNKDVPVEKQLEHAQKVAAEVKEVLDRNHVSGSGSVGIGTSSATFFATAAMAIDADEPEAAAPAVEAPAAE